jgi:hypothetical protein
MGLLTSDTPLFDPALNETLRLLDDLRDLTFSGDAEWDAYDDDGGAPLA